MPLLAGLLGNAFTGFVTFLATWFSKKVAVAAALVAFLIGGWVAIQVTMVGLWNALDFVIPSSIEPSLAVALYLLPANTWPCVQALVLARIARWLWDRQREWALAVAAA